MRRCAGIGILVCVVLVSSSARGELLAAKSLALKSTGLPNGDSFVLSENGFVGTYITLAEAGDVTLEVSAQGEGDPSMGLAIADFSTSFSVGPENHTYSQTLSLPAGTHFVRTQLDNDAGIAGRELKINSLSVTGATFSNAHTNENATAATDTYIANYRQGPARVRIPGVTPGQQVGVSLKRIAFDFGAGAHVEPDGGLLDNRSTTRKRRYQDAFKQNFNGIMTAETSYWLGNEAERGEIEMRGTNEILDFAAANNMTTRLHNMIWEYQSPQWVLDLRLESTYSEESKADLLAAIRDRIDYYVANPHGRFDGIDVYNQSWHDGEDGHGDSFWRIYGPTGIAQIYHEAKQAAPESVMYVNDYEALQGASNRYGRHIDQLRQAGIDAGYGDVVDAIGMQYYTNSTSPTLRKDFMYGLQDMNVRGLPITMTEFGVFHHISKDVAGVLLGQAMRMFFGNPNTDGFWLWDWTLEDNGQWQWSPGAGLYTVNTNNWNSIALTPAGKVWQDTLGIQDWDGNPNNGWTTQLTTVVGADGAIDFNGYYGDYALTIDGVTYNFKLVKGDTEYSIGLAGDFNGDGRVDAADYTVWRDGNQDPARYLEWRDNFGASIVVEGGGGQSVPEVGTLVLTLTAFVACSAARLRRTRDKLPPTR